MTRDEQVPRNALVWIVLSQFALLIPHLPRIPLWVVVVYLFTALWRIMVYQGRWSFPGKYFKAALAASCFLGVAWHYRTLIGLEPTVSLLLSAFALKLVELSARRDAYILIFLAYFVCVTEFLFSQELAVTLYMFFSVWLVTTALVALHEPGADSFNRATLRRAGVMLAQSLPLMVALFFIFPRVGPLWSVPLKQHAARSGMSDFMSPGDVSSLSLSDEVAFRVQFEGTIPPRSQLYWRGLVFSRLQGDAWRSLRWGEVPVTERRAGQVLTDGEPLRYSVILEPTQQNWLYALPYAQSPDRGIMATSDFRLASPVEVQDQRQYEVMSWPGTSLGVEISEWRRDTETTLPLYGSPRARELAQQMFAQAGSPRQFAADVLRMFATGDYYYTLRPPLLGDNPMDDFLFDSRRGFCEHYAASFAFMMRAAGVPARVVAGYQGGEINPVNSTVIVHQFDAHAWNEIWLEGEGWVRIDPTAAIAPSRIEYGLEQALEAEGSFLVDSPLSPLRFRNVQWVNLLRLRLDALNYSWQKFVLGYDRSEQYSVLSKLLGEVSPTRIAITILVLWSVVLLPVALNVLLSRPTRQDPATRLYLQFCAKLLRVGIGRERNEAPASFATRVAAARPDLAGEVDAITGLYDALSYRSEPGEDLLARLKRQVRRFSPR
jgi:transglutaminase-like putative cysteine protease